MPAISHAVRTLDMSAGAPAVTSWSRAALVAETYGPKASWAYRLMSYKLDVASFASGKEHFGPTTYCSFGPKFSAQKLADQEHIRPHLNPASLVDVVLDLDRKPVVHERDAQGIPFLSSMCSLFEADLRFWKKG